MRHPARVAGVLAVLVLVLVLVPAVGGGMVAPASATAGASPAGSRPAPSASGGLVFPATGYFRVARARDRWWLVTPGGQPFYSSGVDHVSADPDTDRRTGLCPYCLTIAAKYPSTAAWATATVRRLRAWGFNTIGAFSDDDTFAKRMPYTELLSMASGDDWFSPSFVADADAVAAADVAPRADDPNLIGWYTDSELHWGPDWRSLDTVLQQYLALPVGSPGRAVAERFVGRPDDFVRVLATRYFRVTTAAIRRYDTHHLILGVKAPAQLIEPALLEAARPYVDVFSIDDYELVPGLEQTIQHLAPEYLDPDPNLANIEAIVRRPIIIGEYGFRAADSGLPNTDPPIFPVFATQADRAAAYEGFVSTMYAAPWVVGDSWFEYVDEPAGGRSEDGENSNWGLVSVADVPYQAVVQAARAVHDRQPASGVAPPT